MMDIQTEQALDHLVKGITSANEIELLRQKLSVGQISIRGDVNHSVIILGDGNTVVQLTPEMVDVLTRRKLAASVPLRNPIVEGINFLPYDYDQKIQNFLKEYLGDEQHPVPFGGRDDALKMLDNWLTETTPYLLLAAPAGRGKSALLVRWLDSLKAHEDLALAFVPVSIRFGTNMERVFYAALAARLAFLHGDDVPASPETSTAVYRGLVSDYLSKPLADGRTLLVVLDGLDEAADWQAGADFLPAELPAGVRVVVSARFLAGDADSTPWLRRLNLERSGLAFAPSLVPLDLDGVRDVLFKMGCPLDELSRKVDIVAELYRLSAGDPLLVRLYVGDLWTKGAEVTRLKPEDLAAIQPGYKGYFDCWWDDQKKLWGKEKPWLEQHVRAVRNLLAGAIGPLFKADIYALNPELESDYIADALDVLQRFVIGDNQTQGYTFSHPKLGQYFWETLTEAEQALVERRFLVWGERTLQEFIDGKRDPKKKDQIPAYVVRNYGAHLARAKQPIEKWLLLIHHQEWAQAWFTVEGAYGGYLQDVQRVWEQCKLFDRRAIETTGKTSCLGEQIRCGLIEASLHSLAGNIPPELIWPLVRDGLWTLPQTWVFIRQMPEADQQSNTIIALIPHLDDKQLPEVLEVAQAIQQDKGSRALMLSALAQRLPEVAGEVLEAVRTIKDIEMRVSILSDLVKFLPAGQAEQALKLIHRITSERELAQIINNLVMFLPQEQLVQVLEIARIFIDHEMRANVLIALIKQLPEVTEEALQAIREIEYDDARASALCALAKYLPEVSGEALLLARAIEYDVARASALGDLAQHLPEVTREALEIAENIENEHTRADVLSDLVQRLPEGRLSQLLESVQAIKNENVRATTLITLAQRMPQEQLLMVFHATEVISDEDAHASILSCLAQRMPTKQLLMVLEAAETIGDEDARAIVLMSLAQHLPEKQLRLILAAAQTMKYESARASILSILAQRLPEVTEEALEAVRTINDEIDQASMLSAMAQHFPEEQLLNVLEMAEMLDYEGARASVLNVLAQRLPEVRATALEVALSIMGEMERSWALNALTQHLPEEQLLQVLEAAQEIEFEGARASVLSALTKRLPEGQLGRVLELTQAIGNENECFKVLIDLTQRLPEEQLPQVLEAAQKIECEDTRVEVLCALTLRMSEEQLKLVIAAVREISEIDARANVLSSLAQRLPELASKALEAAQAIKDEKERAYILRDLAKHLPEEHLDLVLAAAQAMDDKNARADVLSELAQRLPQVFLESLENLWATDDENQRARVLIALAQQQPERRFLLQVLIKTRAIRNGRARAHVLCILAKHLPEEIEEALQVACAIGGEWERAQILSELAQRLPEGQLLQVLAITRSIQNNSDRAGVLSDLVQRLPDAIGEALEAARAIQLKYTRSNVLNKLAQPMMKISYEKSFLSMETSLVELSHRRRFNLFSDLAALMPLIVHLGTDDTPREIYEAVRDVMTWWP